MARFNNIDKMKLLQRVHREGIRYDLYIQDASPAMAALCITDIDSGEVISVTTGDELTILNRRDGLIDKLGPMPDIECIGGVPGAWGCNCKQCIADRWEAHGERIRGC